jgi:thiamine pyrophosphokinase
MQALIIANGAQPSNDTLCILAAQAGCIVCADGGANAARRAGVLPHEIVGDFDSVRPAVLAYYSKRGVGIRHESGQDDTDLEKALRVVLQRGARSVTITGATGNMLDHSIGNLSILSRYAHHFEISLVDSHFLIDIITRPRRFTSTPGQRVSIVPLYEAHGVRFRGLLYPLPGGSLASGENEGTCNEATGVVFSVSLTSGILMVMRAQPTDPVVRKMG